MKRTTLIALAVAGLTFTAAPSYAQSSYGGNTGGSYGNSASSAERDAARAVRKAEKAARKAEKQRLKTEALRAKAAKAETATATDYSFATDAKPVKNNSSATNAKAVKDYSSATGSTEASLIQKKNVTKAKSESLLPVNCPAGTEPQTNGTCMLK